MAGSKRNERKDLPKSGTELRIRRAASFFDTKPIIAIAQLPGSR